METKTECLRLATFTTQPVDSVPLLLLVPVYGYNGGD